MYRRNNSSYLAKRDRSRSRYDYYRSRDWYSPYPSWLFDSQYSNVVQNISNSGWMNNVNQIANVYQNDGYYYRGYR